jgi:hypothetical protein
MTKVTAVCPDCKREFEGKDQWRANMAVGIHRRREHGYISPKYDQRKAERLRATARKTGSPMTIAESLARARLARFGTEKPETEPGAKGSPEWKAKRKKYQDKYRAQHRAAKLNSMQNGMSASTAVSCKLSECPVCGARFYVAKGQQG